MADPNEDAEIYTAGETVLAYHGPLLYEAKVLATEKRMDQTGEEVNLYLTHYRGWNRSWDEWLNSTRIKKHNATNLEVQRLLAERVGKKKRNKSQASGGRGLGRSKDFDSSSKKRRSDRDGPDDDMMGGSFRIAEPKVVIPDDLKLALVDDWNLITRQSKIVKLPRSPTINQVLSNYCTFIATQGPKASGVAREVTSGIKLYFQAACGSILLYRQERPQYDELVQENKTIDLCDHYGTEHLLRLFVKLPSMIQHSGVGAKGMVYLVKCFQDILHFIKTEDSPAIDAATYTAYSTSYAQKIKA
eukprot:m.111261 g.111261  ORF g.111261 m.111261 type:complete len:302 (-) comp28107_c5_seq1:347-1252(-)